MQIKVHVLHLSTNLFIPCENSLTASILCLYRGNSHFFHNEHQESSFSFIAYWSLQWQQCISSERKAASLGKYLKDSSQELFFIVFAVEGSSLPCSYCLSLLSTHLQAINHSFHSAGCKTCRQHTYCLSLWFVCSFFPSILTKYILSCISDGLTFPVVRSCFVSSL